MSIKPEVELIFTIVLWKNGLNVRYLENNKTYDVWTERSDGKQSMGSGGFKVIWVKVLSTNRGIQH